MSDPLIGGARLPTKSESEGKTAKPTGPSFHLTHIEKHHSQDDFNKFFTNQEMFANFREKCMYGEMEHCNTRWTAWRAFLGLFPIGDEKAIREKVKKDRDFYLKEYDKYTNFRAKSKLDIAIDNPLSTSTKNPWNSHFEDSELKYEIAKDVERTYQDVEFFHTKEAQDMLTNILFVWCKQNLDLGYRQGMNELAGLFTIVCFTENYAEGNPDSNLYDFLNDRKYAEADIYAAYNKAMQLNQKQMFVYQPPKDDKKKKKPASGEVNRPNLPVVHRAAHIQETLLPQLNTRLSDHLTKMGVEPQIYMMRWIRCMLSREYRISQTLMVWDSLFGFYSKYPPTTPTLEFLDYLCVAMLLYISDHILEKDDNGSILGRLMKYPPVDKVSAIIDLAHKEVHAPLKSGKTIVQDSSKYKQFDPTSIVPEKPKVSEDKKAVLFNPSATILKTNVRKEEAITKHYASKNEDDPLANMPSKPVMKKEFSTESPSTSTSSSSGFTIKKSADNNLFGGITNSIKSSNLFQSLTGSNTNTTSNSGSNRGSLTTKEREEPINKPVLLGSTSSTSSKPQPKLSPAAETAKEQNEKAINKLNAVAAELIEENEKNPTDVLQKAIDKILEVIDGLNANSKVIQNLK